MRDTATTATTAAELTPARPAWRRARCRLRRRVRLVHRSAGGDAVERDRRRTRSPGPAATAVPTSFFWQAVEHLAADVAGAEQRADHDDAERHHDHLVEAEQDRAAGDRQLHLEQAAATACSRTTRRPRSSTTGTLRSAVVGEPHGRRHGVDHRGHAPPAGTGCRTADETPRYTNTGITWAVSRKPRSTVSARSRAGRPDPERDADQQRDERRRRSSTRQRDHRQVPVADDADARQRQRARRPRPASRRCDSRSPAVSASTPGQRSCRAGSTARIAAPLDHVGDRAEDAA